MVLEQNRVMRRSNVVKSQRETGRFSAVDELGNLHTVVERATVKTAVTFAITYQGVETGEKSYYSMTTGDALERIDGRRFAGRGGALKLRLVSGEGIVSED